MYLPSDMEPLLKGSPPLLPSPEMSASSFEIVTILVFFFDGINTGNRSKRHEKKRSNNQQYLFFHLFTLPYSVIVSMSSFGKNDEKGPSNFRSLYKNYIHLVFLMLRLSK